jgi:hypothetical protein
MVGTPSLPKDEYFAHSELLQVVFYVLRFLWDALHYIFFSVFTFKVNNYESITIHKRWNRGQPNDLNMTATLY